MKLKCIVTLSARYFEPKALPAKLTDIQAWVTARLAEIPAEYHDSATLNVGIEDDYGDARYVTYEIEYWRPKTDDEIATEARIAEHNRLEAIRRAEAVIARLKGEAR